MSPQEEVGKRREGGKGTVKVGVHCIKMGKTGEMWEWFVKILP
jgi:hypothetical protein